MFDPKFENVHVSVPLSQDFVGQSWILKLWRSSFFESVNYPILDLIG